MTMTRNDPDERFDVVDVSRRGAHRARPNPVTGLLPLVALAVVVFAVVGVAVMLFGRDGTSGSPQAGAVPKASASVPVITSPSPQVEQSSPAPSASSASQPAATVDKKVTLNFYNGTSPNIPGHSRKAAAQLEAAGWRVGTVLPWDGAPVSRTTVYYGDAVQLETARAVVKALGAGTVKLNTVKAAQGLAVVVSNDYTP